MTKSALRLLASSQIASVLTDGGGLFVSKTMTNKMLSSTVILAKMHTGAGSR